MLEKIQEKFYKKIRKGLLNQTSIEVPFKNLVVGWFTNQKVDDQVLTNALLKFDKKYNLDHIIILNGRKAEAIRFWWQKGKIMEGGEQNA